VLEGVSGRHPQAIEDRGSINGRKSPEGGKKSGGER